MAKSQLVSKYTHIISIDNLLAAWKEFLCGKRSRLDVQRFEQKLMPNIFSLHSDLVNKSYTHSAYKAFAISDPKPRCIHKASVRDRLLHHAIYRVLYPFFDKTFISDSYSCRLNKGTHQALNQFRRYLYRASYNHTRTVWILKCDIRKFFASIDQRMLIDIIKSYIPDSDILWLISQIVGSFHSTEKGKGLPLGNLTSQLLVNVYMNEFDQFVKHWLKAKYYIRYADDFVIISTDKHWLVSLVPLIKNFLREPLSLTLHPKKVSIESAASGVDFLGWVHFPDHRILRTVARRRMLRRVSSRSDNESVIQSYIGLLKHGNTQRLGRKVHQLAYNELTPKEHDHSS